MQKEKKGSMQRNGSRVQIKEIIFAQIGFKWNVACWLMLQLPRITLLFGSHVQGAPSMKYY